MYSEILIKLFEIKKRNFTLLFMGQFFFRNFLIIFRHYYYAKYICLTSLIWLIFFIFSLCREILKFKWDQTFG